MMGVHQNFNEENESTFFDNPPSEDIPIRAEPLRVSKDIKAKQSMS
jgi:hypothetical protein